MVMYATCLAGVKCHDILKTAIQHGGVPVRRNLEMFFKSGNNEKKYQALVISMCRTFLHCSAWTSQYSQELL